MGKFDDLDKKDDEARRKAQIELRNKKRNSNTLLFFGTIFEIVESFILILLLFIIFAKVISLFAEGDLFQTLFSIATIIAFIGGLVLGFIIYKKLMQFVIKKFNLKDKLTDEVLFHYDKETRKKFDEEHKK